MRVLAFRKRLFEHKKNEEKSRWVCEEGIKYFKGHAMKHFAEEEAYMAHIHYMGFDVHRRLHDDFRKKTLTALERELEQSNYSEDAVNHFLGVCAGWLVGHTLTEDRAITGKTMSKWGELLPEEEQTAMGQTIIQLLHDMFMLDAKVVSECYGGEKFGTGIYYRLVYSTKHGKKWEILLVFEQKLIVNTVGHMMDSDTDTVNVMLMNAVRHMAQQFVNRVSERFPSADMYEIKEENLLSYEQFERKFQDQTPQFSLLFDTGAGYFAYCVIAPHLLQDGNGVSIKADNAMTEIKKYLDKNKKSTKKKILIVDDSDVMLHAMKGLLEKDYEVALAKSGLSAIRSITLDRPDLVLLDYEMPVCNGSQVLEMIRAEEDFADIPVVFLTGRGDKESVKKVIALKPQGYLVKNMAPGDIKKSIDQFMKD